MKYNEEEFVDFFNALKQEMFDSFDFGKCTTTNQLVKNINNFEKKAIKSLFCGDCELSIVLTDGNIITYQRCNDEDCSFNEEASRVIDMLYSYNVLK